MFGVWHSDRVQRLVGGVLQRGWKDLGISGGREAADECRHRTNCHQPEPAMATSPDARAQRPGLISLVDVGSEHGERRALARQLFGPTAGGQCPHELF